MAIGCGAGRRRRRGRRHRTADHRLPPGGDRCRRSRHRSRLSRARRSGATPRRHASATCAGRPTRRGSRRRARGSEPWSWPGRAWRCSASARCATTTATSGCSSGPIRAAAACNRCRASLPTRTRPRQRWRRCATRASRCRACSRSNTSFSASGSEALADADDPDRSFRCRYGAAIAGAIALTARRDRRPLGRRRTAMPTLMREAGPDNPVYRSHGEVVQELIKSCREQVQLDQQLKLAFTIGDDAGGRQAEAGAVLAVEPDDPVDPGQSRRRRFALRAGRDRRDPARGCRLAGGLARLRDQERRRPRSSKLVDTGTPWETLVDGSEEPRRASPTRRFRSAARPSCLSTAIRMRSA